MITNIYRYKIIYHKYNSKMSSFSSGYAIKCIEKYKLANPDKEVPSNMGSKWTTTEEQSLLDNLKNNLDIDDIAKKHSRTTGAINARREVIALRLYNENKLCIDKIEVITKLNEKTILEAIDRKNKKYKNDINGSYNIDRNCDNIDIINLKMDLKRCYEEIKELKENVKNIMELGSRNKRDDIEDLKTQIQSMLDINNIKNDIIELKNAIKSKI